MEQHFIYIEKRQREISLHGGHHCPRPVATPGSLGTTGLHAHLLHHRMKTPVPSPLATGYRSEVGQVPYALSKTKERILSLKQGKMCPHKVLSLAHIVRTLSLLGRTVPGPKSTPMHKGHCLSPGSTFTITLLGNCIESINVLSFCFQTQHKCISLNGIFL